MVDPIVTGLSTSLALWPTLHYFYHLNSNRLSALQQALPPPCLYPSRIKRCLVGLTLGPMLGQCTVREVLPDRFDGAFRTVVHHAMLLTY